MPTINDYKKKALNNLGYLGDINTAESKWLKAVCSPYVGVIPDMWRYALKQVGFTGGLIEMQNELLKALEYTDLSISNKWYKYWKNGAGPAWGLEGSVLDIDFANSRAYNSKVPFKTTPDSILTYTSPSPKLVYGDDGVLRYAPHNLLLQSQTFETASWSKGNATISANAVAAPDGTTTADAMFTTAVTATFFVSQSVTTAAVAHTFSVYAKPNGYNFIFLFNGTTGQGRVFNVATGVKGGTAGNSAPTSDDIVSVGNGWYRCSITGTCTAASNSFRVYVMSSDAGSAAFTADGVSGLYIWGAQLQITPNHSNAYIPTTTAAVYSLPIDHNPTTFEPLGVLIEEQRTNLCLYSDDFTNAAWVKSNLTAAKTATGPDGVTNSASTLTATAANATARQNVTSASAARITSMFVKRRTGTGAVYLSQGGTTGSELVVNGTFTTNTTGWTASGATLAVVSSELEVTNTGAAAGIADSDAFATVVGTAYLVGYTARRGTSSSVGIEVRTTSGSAEASITLTNTSNVDGFLYFIASTTSTFIRVSSNQAVLGRTGYFDNLSVKAAVETTVTVTSDWTRVATASATITNPPLIIRMATSGDAIDVALFQHELGAFITSPIPTVASQVTRLADQVSILTSAFGYSQTEMTIAGQYQQLVATTVSVPRTTLCAASSGNNRLEMRGADSGLGALAAYGTGVGVASLGPAAGVAANTPTKLAFAAGASGGALYQNGAQAASNPTSASAPNVGTGTFGVGYNPSAGGQLNGHIKRLTYFPTRRSNADLQVLTT